MLRLLRLAMRMTQRDWRAGQLHFLLVALVVAVSALSSVGFFVERIGAGLNRDALQLLGADLLINADQPLKPTWVDEARARDLRIAETVGFPSMALAGSGEQSLSVLVALKAVSPAYPLRGKLKITDKPELADASSDAGTPTGEIPTPGTVWVDPSLLAKLNLGLGGRLRMGDKEFIVSKMIKSEPDRGAGFMNFSPRVMLNLQDLPATNLIQLGSRVSYRLLLAADDTQKIAGYQAWVQQQIESTNLKGVRIESVQSGRPEMQNTIKRAEQFLALVGLLTALLAAVAIAMAARRFMLRHIDSFAMLRFLGLRQNQVLAMFLLEFLIIGLIASLIGAAFGFGFHFLLLNWLGSLVTVELPAPSILPALQALVTGLLLLVGFAMPPILQLRNVPHNRVIRREAQAPQAGALLSYCIGALAFIALLLWQARDLKLGLLTSGGFFAGFALFALLAWLSLKLLQLARPAIQFPAWRFAVHSLQRRPAATILQVVSLALGLMALLLLTIVRGDLVGAWQKATPVDAPNRFVINIQPEQKDEIKAKLDQMQAASGASKKIAMYPMIRGRLIEINGKPTKLSAYQDDSARRLLDREFNISTMQDAPADNQIVAGQWYAATSATAEASVEEGLAKTLQLKLGDQLKFDIGGQVVDAKMTSLRKLDWNSMKVNFFVIINPPAVQELPQTWITSFHLPTQQAAFGNQLTRDYPNLTVVDVSLMLKQVGDVLEQVIAAVEFLFVFTLAAGGLVLYAALVGSQDERAREAGLMRALGATRRQLSRAQMLEFLLVGSLAGLLAASGAAAIGWALARFIFEFPWVFNWQLWLIGAAAGAACALLGGWYGLRAVLTQPPLQTLREA